MPKESSPAGVTAQLMEIGRAHAKERLAVDVRKVELAGKAYLEALRGSGEVGACLRSMGYECVRSREVLQ
jgi:hypothetical protein